MSAFGRFYLDKEKDVIVELEKEGEELKYLLRTPNHRTGNLITNLARLCSLPLSLDEEGLKVIRGRIPCYIDDRNRAVYIFHLGETKVANIYPDGTVERKAAIPAIAKTLMSQTKDYRLDFRKTLVKTYIPREVKFRTDLHTHMNANLDPDLLIALGIHHQIRYPLYYIKKLELRLSREQWEKLEKRRQKAQERLKDSPLEGKYLTRKIWDNTFINFADLILNNLDNASYNIPRIRASLAVMKDGQAVFTNLEKVYLYRYVFTKGVTFEEEEEQEEGQEERQREGKGERQGEKQGEELGERQGEKQREELGETQREEKEESRKQKEKQEERWQQVEKIPDQDIQRALRQMEEDGRNPAYAGFTLFQDKLLWTARSFQRKGIVYAEISDTSLVKPHQAAQVLAQMHEAMPAITRETGVTLRLLGGIRRIPLTIVKDQISAQGDWAQQVATLRAVAQDPYVAGSDIIGEEMNDIRDLSSVLEELVKVAGEEPGFVLRIHAGENDSLPDNVANSLHCVRQALAPGQKMPPLRIGHGLYTANLHSAKGQRLIHDLRESGVVLEFQITSNVRLNNLSSLARHPLKEYLRGGILCVQGTDGGALYGTDSIDEQLTLERLLELSREELLAMRRAEDGVLMESLHTFEEKKERFEALLGGRDVVSYLTERISRGESENRDLLVMHQKRESRLELKEQIRDMPADKLPVVVLGGSFNSQQHKTRMREDLKELIGTLVRRLDPKRVFFVVGHQMSAYERELVEAAGGRFEIFAIVPTLLTPQEAGRLKRSKVGIRLSIEASGMGVYKSFAYEIFKRRPSLVLALDGNSAGANTIQEAKNGKKKAKIFVCSHAPTLRAKAETLEGYVQLFEGGEVAEEILRAVEEEGK